MDIGTPPLLGAHRNGNVRRPAPPNGAAAKPRKRAGKVKSAEDHKATRVRTKKREQQGLLMPFALLKQVRVSRLVKVPHERFILRKDSQTLRQAEEVCRSVVSLLHGVNSMDGEDLEVDLDVIRSFTAGPS